jgi:hypothetical protein
MSRQVNPGMNPDVCREVCRPTAGEKVNHPGELPKLQGVRLATISANWSIMQSQRKIRVPTRRLPYRCPGWVV